MNIETFYTSYFIFENQCYLIYNNGGGILIDPSWNFELINYFLSSNSVNLKAVLITHSHIDHINLAKTFAIKYNIPIFISRIEWENFDAKTLNVNFVDHLSEIQIAGLNVLPIITPGHTMGSTCYLINQNLFSGDTIFIEGVGACINPDKMYDSVQFLKKYLPPDTLIWPGHSFGQSPGKSLDFLLKNNIYFQIEKRQHFVDFRTRKNQPSHFNFKNRSL